MAYLERKHSFTIFFLIFFWQVKFVKIKRVLLGVALVETKFHEFFTEFFVLSKIRQTLSITLEPLEHHIQNASKFDVVFLTSVYPCKYASCKTHILQIVAFAGGGVVLMLKFTCKKHTFYFCSDFFEASFRCFFPA